MQNMDSSLNEINDLLRQFQQVCEVKLKLTPPNLQKYCPNVSLIPQDIITDDNPKHLDTSFFLVGAYGRIFKGLQFSHPKLTSVQGGKRCQEIDSIAGRTMTVVCSLTGIWDDNWPLWNVGGANQTTEEKFDYIALFLQTFLMAAKERGMGIPYIPEVRRKGGTY